MRINTNNNNRTVNEMNEMFEWCLKNFGMPGEESPHRWTYGKDSGWLGNNLCSGPFDIEWLDFHNDKDASFFLLVWA